MKEPKLITTESQSSNLVETVFNSLRLWLYAFGISLRIGKPKAKRQQD